MFWGSFLWAIRGYTIVLCPVALGGVHYDCQFWGHYDSMSDHHSDYIINLVHSPPKDCATVAVSFRLGTMHGPVKKQKILSIYILNLEIQGL